MGPERPIWVLKGSIWVLMGPIWVLNGPIWVLKGTIWVLKGPLWVPEGPQRSQMGPQNGKCAETARGVFRNEGASRSRSELSVKPQGRGYILIRSSDGGPHLYGLRPAYGCL